LSTAASSAPVGSRLSAAHASTAESLGSRQPVALHRDPTVGCAVGSRPLGARWRPTRPRSRRRSRPQRPSARGSLAAAPSTPAGLWPFATLRSTSCPLGASQPVVLHRAHVDGCALGARRPRGHQPRSPWRLRQPSAPVGWKPFDTLRSTSALLAQVGPRSSAALASTAASLAPVVRVAISHALPDGCAPAAPAGWWPFATLPTVASSSAPTGPRSSAALFDGCVLGAPQPGAISRVSADGCALRARRLVALCQRPVGSCPLGTSRPTILRHARADGCILGTRRPRGGQPHSP
jgi:hypothetical protein